MRIEYRHPSKAAAIEDTYPLSALQQGMLLHTLLDPISGVDVEQFVFELHEVLDVDNFKRAWRHVIARHTALRTGFRWQGLEQPRQQVRAKVELPWKEHDWRGITDNAREKRYADFLCADRRRGFDMAEAPLSRLTLLRYGAAESRFIWTIHHALLDGRSFTIVLREMFALYEAFCRGEELVLPAPRPYRDYIDWLQQQDFHKDELFWRQKLRGFDTPTPLMIDRGQRADDRSKNRSVYHEIELSTEVTSALRSLGEENDLTLTTIVQGSWALLLSRYSGEADVVFGVIRAARHSTVEGAENMVGLFVNTLPLRVHIREDEPLLSWLKKLREQWIALGEHEHTPLAKAQNWSDVRGKPLFDSTVMFESQSAKRAGREQRNTLSGRRYRILIQPSYPLNLGGYDGPKLRLKLDYDGDRVDDTAAKRMLGHLQTLLESIAARPDQRLGDLPLLTSSERDWLMAERSGSATKNQTNDCLHRLFEAQVEQTPDAIAVTFENEHLTYRELNQRSNRLAHYLREVGIGPDVLVAIYAERSLQMVVGLMGILKAGGAYAPIDPTYPAQRVAHMLNDVGSSIVLAQQNLIPKLPITKGATVVNLDSTDWSSAAGSTDNPPLTTTSENLAYVIYTSGSTGNPKGTMIPHRGIVNHIRWMQSTFPMNENDCVLQKTEFSFDVSVWEFFAPLSVGARLMLARPGGHQDAVYLARTILQHGVTVLQLVPSLLRMLLEIEEFKACRNLRDVFCGGDVLTADVVQQFYACLDANLHNMYGPTEVAIDSLFYSVPRVRLYKTIPIGKPVANTQAYILDHELRPVPIGVPGELYLGGVQVGRGYHNQPTLTADRFIPDVFSRIANARLYRTGDRVRYLPDGNIEFIARLDHQVKIRGYRIELGEIERTLQQNPAVGECVVIVREDVIGEKVLVAYVTSKSPDVAGKLRSFLKQQLPPHMIPGAIIALHTFPLTPNGKLDRKALPAPDGQLLEYGKLYVAPRTSSEHALAEVWRDVLGVSKIGVHDDFFDLGGHSLMVVRLIYAINRRHKVNLGVAEIFRNPTVEQLARVIDGQKPKSKRRPAVVQLQKGVAEPSVYLIHAGLDEFRLAQMMGDKYPIFAVEVPLPLAWRNAVAANQTDAFPTMEQLVAPYVTELSAHTGSSPCVLAGYSFAGRVAFEVAHQLQRQGGKVESVILFDTWAKTPNPYHIAWQNLRHCWSENPDRRLSDRLSASIRSSFRRGRLIIQWLIEKEKLRARSLFLRPVLNPNELTPMLDDEGMPLHWGLLERLYMRLNDSYQPRPLDSRGILFRTEMIDVKKSIRAINDSLGWQNLFTKGLEIVPITGDHHSMIREDCHNLAQGVNEVLERHWPSQYDKVHLDAHEPRRVSSGS